MKSQHTPGPWLYTVSGSRVGRNYSLSAKKANGWVNILHGNEKHTTETRATADEALANARLIAASPDLLAALDRLTNAAFARDNTMGDPCALLAAQAKLRDATRQARAAIAKATGATPC